MTVSWSYHIITLHHSELLISSHTQLMILFLQLQQSAIYLQRATASTSLNVKVGCQWWQGEDTRGRPLSARVNKKQPSMTLESTMTCHYCDIDSHLINLCRESSTLHLTNSEVSTMILHTNRKSSCLMMTVQNLFIHPSKLEYL